jgi:hypothetical protein
VVQESAVDLLAAGKNDTETAAELGVHRVTVTRWRRYNPEFQAALAERRAGVWGSAADKLRALLPKAVERVAEALDSPDAAVRTAAAFNVLRLAGPLPIVPVEPASADEIVRRKVEAERDHQRSRRDDSDLTDAISSGLPNFDDHMKIMRTRLDVLAGTGEGEVSDPKMAADLKTKLSRRGSRTPRLSRRKGH